MLVSMECLIGSKYLTRVEQVNLAGALNPNMGRREARYSSPAIGLMSEYAQRWIDRNFSFDYTLKSIEKIADPHSRQHVHGIRLIIRRASYELLGMMLTVATGDAALTPEEFPASSYARLQAMVNTWQRAGPSDAVLTTLLNDQFHRLLSLVEHAIHGIRLDPSHQRIIDLEFDRWSRRQAWNLINGLVG
jgi:hypothetical protein